MNARFRSRLLLSPLFAARRTYATIAAKSDDPSKIRTIGVVAHIDAGKTTTTERMLFYSGMSESMGEVHDGDTVTDYMPQERERGITITSAAISFPWKKHIINLLDTPGHVDFTFEVERCLSVIDGSIVILDASAGVEAQTTTVWRQADKFNLSRIVYLNKMDKKTANITLCMKSLEKIGANPYLIQLPVYSGDRFTGVVDILNFHKYVWGKDIDCGKQFEKTILDSQSDVKLYEMCCEKREELIGFLSDVDNELGDYVMSCNNLVEVPSNVVLNALRRATINNLTQPVVCGSSYKNIAVQPLMDAVVKFFPSPVENPINVVKYYENRVCVLVFKIIHHKILGPLTFARIYSGTLRPMSKVYNINRQTYEKINKLYVPHADEFREVPSMSSGNIVVLSGIRESITGDTLTSSLEDVNEITRKYSEDTSTPIDDCQPLLAGVESPVPVFFCSVEAPSPSKQKDLEKALANLQREDPSMVVSTNVESGQTVISGMGALHIEIIKDRILKEYNVEAYVGPLQICYRESIDDVVEESVNLDKVVSDVRNVISITLRLKAKLGIGTPKKVKVIATTENELSHIKPFRLKAIESGMSLALNNGPIMGFPVVDVEVELLNLQVSSKTTSSMLAAATSQCITNALRKSSPFLLEPLMEVEVSVPQQYVKGVLASLSIRRSILGDIEHQNEYRILRAQTPLSELLNYSSELRSLSSGTASLSMKLSCYRKMNESEMKKATDFS